MATKYTSSTWAGTNSTFATFKAWAGDITAAPGTGTGIAAILNQLGFTKLSDTYTANWDNGTTVGAGALPNLTAGAGGNLFGTTFPTTTANARAGLAGSHFKGAYNGGTAYSIGDVVTDNAGGAAIVYIATAAGTGNATTNTSFWSPYWMEIWKFTGGGLTDVFIKLEYGCGSSSATNPQLSIQLGTAYVANSGVINGSGNFSQAEQVFVGTATMASGDIYVYGDGINALGFIFGRQNVNCAYFFTERSISGQVASAPVYTSSYMTIISCPGAVGQWHQSSLFLSGGTVQTQRFLSVMTVALNASAISYATNNITPSFPVFPTPGWVGNPMTILIGLSNSDTVENSSISTTVYGATHTYITTKTAGSGCVGMGGAAGSGYGLGMRYE
jgi:hypothetical protein